MLIDWFTVGAQALNFLILVWLLKRFLYQPILNAIDVREKKIAKELADADAKKAEAQKEHEEFDHKNEVFDQQRAALLSQATGEVKIERRRLLDEARTAADALSAKRKDALISEAQNLNQAVSRLAQKEVFGITRKALADLATTSLEERMGEVFDRRLRELDENAKLALGEALKKNAEPAVIRSAFNMPEEQRAAIQNALNETFSAEIRVRFETAPELVSGIELTANGQKVGWNIANYLASLEKSVGELLKEQNKPEPKAVVKAAGAAEVKVEAGPKTEPVPAPEVPVESKPAIPAKPTPKVEPAVPTNAKVEAESKAKLKPETGIKVEPGAEAKVESKPSPIAK